MVNPGPEHDLERHQAGTEHDSGTDLTDTDSDVIRLHEETLEPRIVDRERGKVLIHTRVEATPVSEEITLRQGHVDIDRVERNETVTERRDPWYEDGTLMIPVYEEVPVTEIRLVLREVIQVRQTETAEQATIEGEARREIVEIERTGDA